MRSRKPIRRKRKSPSSKVRKPVPPPTKVEEPPTTYRRARERERLRREEDGTDAWLPAIFDSYMNIAPSTGTRPSGGTFVRAYPLSDAFGQRQD